MPGTITLCVETKMRPSFVPKRKRKPWLYYSVWRDLVGEGRERMGYLLWEKCVRRNAPWPQRAALAQEQERIAAIAAGQEG
jgi:hypothetical protein